MKCSNCGTDNGIIIPFGGKQIKCYISDVIVHVDGYSVRDVDGIIHRMEIKQYEFKVLSL